MSVLRIDTVIEADGELHLSNLPFRRGDRVEAILVQPVEREAAARQAARERFLARAGFEFPVGRTLADAGCALSLNEK